MFSPDTSGRKLLSVPTPHTAAAAPSTQSTGIVSRFSGVTPRSASSRLTLRAPRLSASASRSSRRQRRAVTDSITQNKTCEFQKYTGYRFIRY